MSHRAAVLTMIAVTLMWSIAGVVSRHIEAARGFEVTFWRSFFNAVAMLVMLFALRGPAALARSLRDGGAALWISGVCWAVMYTAFMLALTLTTVANVLVLIALTPLITALAARFALGHRLAPRTWGAIALAGAGIVWMYAREVSGAEPRHLLGMAIGLAVPLAAALNWTLMQHNRGAAQQDMLPAVLIGAALSALVTLPPALPFAATRGDFGLLALLGVVQLAIPCLLAVRVARWLPAPELSLLGLLEVIFGVLWAWLGANEAPSANVLGGGLLVIAALAGNELMALRERRA